MTKARILANLISDNAELADGQISVAEVVGAAPLASPTFTGTVTTAAVTMNGYLTVNGGGVDVNTVIYPNGIAMEDSRAISFGTGADFELSSGGTFLDHNLKDNARHLRIINGLTEHHRFSGDGSVIFNNSGADADFRVESDNNDHMLFLDAGNDRIGIANSAPTTTLDVSGTITADNFTNVDLSPIASTISDTAVDVFVYDTSKDSDGGAWRKRTQHTSWYNEAASATRGSRKEFPAVAVIVAESNQVTIYDGDDPDLPMWMVFNSAGNYFLNEPTVSAVTMLNGKLAVTGTASNHTALAIGDFVSEFCQIIRSNYDGDATGLVNRNQSFWSSNRGNTRIVNNVVNDVAMTVLPNAPIYSATGLPVPTIAVATDGGVSVIKDDGSVVDITDATDAFGTVEFTQTNRLIIGYKAYTGMMVSGGIPIADTTRSNWSSHYYQNNSVPALTGGVAKKVAEYNFGDSYGLTLLEENETSMAQGSVAYITSDYATGHMVGDIKLATLSDTSTTNVTGAELVDNGNFNNGGDWSFGGGWNFANGQAEIDTTNNDLLSQDIGMVSGKTYTVSLVMTAYTDGVLDVRLGGTATQTATGTGVHTFTGVAGGSTLQIYAFTNATLSIDDISVRLAEEDRSVNGNGLQVFGTVTKNPVATGADLVAYSGFSASNYLEQPYNSDLNFGTGDFSFMVWLNTPDNSAAGTIIHRSSSTKAQSNFLSSGAVIQIEFNGTNLYGLVGTNGFSVNTGPDIPRANIPNNIWTHYALVRNGSTLSAYLNGKLFDTDTNTLTTTNTSATLFYGERPGSSRPFNGKMALTKWSATAPSAEQIKKIYEDEKHLFQTGAQATLYGSSDAVTALAYDDSTELLHVGTSAGRSVFQGLRRVSNTTDAVGAAISASNGLVAED